MWYMCLIVVQEDLVRKDGLIHLCLPGRGINKAPETHLAPSLNKNRKEG